MRDLPIIRIELEGLRSGVLHAISERGIQHDAYVKAALDRFLEPANLQAVIDSHVDKEINEAIKREAESFFRHGDGRKFIADAVAARLAEPMS